MRPVRSAATEVEALMLMGLLEGAGIPVTFLPKWSSAYAGELTPPEWGDLLVPDDRVDEARDLVAGYLSAQVDDVP